MTPADVAIRPAGPGDAPAVGVLMAQLGYPAAEAETAVRLGRLLTAPGHALLVAVIGAHPVGLAHAVLLPLLEDDGSAFLVALVVDEAHRGRGIGARLVGAVEAWAAAAGAHRVVVRSNIIRTRTHTFYERLGFVRAKTQLNFRKALEASPSPKRNDPLIPA
jgi:GNAT superfamily N-acetyltransferase